MPVDLEVMLSASPPIFGLVELPYAPFRPNKNGYSKVRPSEEKRNNKKRVWFADDKGLALTQVKIMNEPSNCPPRWTDDFLAQVTGGIAKPSPVPQIEWRAQFAQPASDYLEFRSRLQRNCVSLENVIVPEGGGDITGTVKVKNIAFDKEVFLRVTYDEWKSSEDVYATFVPTEGSMYDTFSFSLSPPQKSESIEFCVGFRCAGNEFWDNNSGQNYKLTSQKSSENGKSVKDALQVNLDSWSEFASWSHLITEGPYW